jgi:hypothetical protein
MNRNAYPKRRAALSSTTLVNIANTPLRQLFWSAPEPSAMFDEAEKRIAECLRKALSHEPVQLLDDLYEDLAY